MKKSMRMLLLAAAIFSHSQSFSQGIKSRTKVVNLSRSSKLNWYMKSLAAVKPVSNSSSSVISTRTTGGNRVEIGVGLSGSSLGFTPNGSPRQETTGDAVCNVQPMKIDFVGSDNFNLFTSENSIMPGQFYNIPSIINNSFSAFNAPARKPYQLGISIFNANNPGPNMLVVNDLSRSPLPEVQSTLLAPNYGASIPAEGVFDMVKINSAIELKANFETSSGIFLPLEEFGIPADITAGIETEGSASNTTNLKYFMVHFIQPMYTINVLTNHNELFQSPTAHSSCTNGAYVESVTYGRRLVIIIGSADSETKVRAALSAALSASITGTEAAGLEVGHEISGESSASLRATAQKFHARIYGGEGTFANRIFSDIVNFKDAFKQYISSASAGRFSAQTGALPLHYTLRRISDNSLLSVRSVGSFEDVVACNISKYKVEVLYKGFKVDKVLEAPMDDKEDIYGSLTLRSVSVNGSEQNKNLSIKSISKDNAVSKKAGETDSDDINVKVMENVSKTNLLNSILNFSQAFKDWEPVHAPAYKENSSSELKFNLGNYADQINDLQPGQSKVLTNDIKLTETSAVGESKITVFTQIRITRN